MGLLSESESETDCLSTPFGTAGVWEYDQVQGKHVFSALGSFPDDGFFSDIEELERDFYGPGFYQLLPITQKAQRSHQGGPSGKAI